MSRWTDDESASLDRAIKAAREQARRERRKSQPTNKRTPDGPARGEVTPAELARRKAMDRAVQRRAQREGDN